MSDTIKPALTAEEWAALKKAADTGLGPARVELERDGLYVWRMGHAAILPNDLRPATAALCLHGQPFGFTWEDVDMVRDADVNGYLDRSAAERRYRDLAERIAALLPPREP